MWYAEFKRGCTSTDDAAHSSRLNEAITEEKYQKMHCIDLDDNKIKLSEIVDMVKITR